MNSDPTKQADELRQLYESGQMTAETYQAMKTLLDQQGKLLLVGTVKGSGAMAQGEGAMGVGAGGLGVGGNLIGNASIVNNQYTGSSPQDATEALRIYCAVLIEKWRHVGLRGLDKQASDSTAQGSNPLQLDQVYVNLHTTTHHEREDQEHEARPVTALEAVVRHPHAVLLGDQGSGKSTFVNFLALCLASAWLEPDGPWMKKLPGWEGVKSGTFIPIPVTLREFVQWVPDGTAKPAPAHIWRFLCSRWKAQNLQFVMEPLQHCLDNGTAIVLFDGLDEAAKEEQLLWVSEAVRSFMQRYSKSRMLVTCRVVPFQDLKKHFEGISPVELAPFNPDQIDGFIQSWYAELYRAKQLTSQQEVETLIRQLTEAVRRRDIQRLAPNPLLLTVMALVNAHKGRLPDARALLYEEAVEILLWRWEQIKVQKEEQEVGVLQLLRDVQRTEVDLKRVLWEIAFNAHQHGSSGDNRVADIGQMDVIQALAGLHPKKSLDWGKAVVETIKLRAGLLVEKMPGVFTFPHRTFQEYLAGAHLGAQANFIRQAAELAGEYAVWREVILFAVGRLVYSGGDIERPLTLIAELCPAQKKEGSIAEWHKQWLAGDIVKEIGINRVKDLSLGRELLPRVQTRLVSVMRESPLSLRERAEAGNTLADIGDPRFREDAWWLPDETLLGFVEIPAGLFQMGETGKTTTIEIPYTYYVSRYPVTQAQFQAFVEDGGYQGESLWPEAKAAGIWEAGKVRGPFDEEPRRQPEKFGDPFGLANHPVVGVTWYEALAYCRWLTQKLRDWKGTPESLKILQGRGGKSDKRLSIILPNEPEWEKAARGTNDDRMYPWGEEVDPNKANYSATQINATTTAGCFRKGASPYGVEEMSGNVWEWTRSVYEEKLYSQEPKDWSTGEDLTAGMDHSRVLCGGSWDNGFDDVRCADRFWNFPVYRNLFVGFRVVASPFSSR